MPLNEILSFFAKFIEQELGIVYAEANYFQLQNRLEDIAKLQGIASLEALYIHAKSGITGAFRQLLMDVATNNETSFFRDPRLFRALENSLLKTMVEAKHQHTFKVWSAASSTGQEAISTAILLQEFMAKSATPCGFSILGTDISERVLAIANAGTYSQLEIQRGMPATHLVKYFKKDAQDRWATSRDLMNKISFRKQNLKAAFPSSDVFDLILCRNVLIYQNVAGKAEIMSRLTQQLAPQGFLILGSGESLFGISNAYEQVNVDGAIVYRKLPAGASKVA